MHRMYHVVVILESWYLMLVSAVQYVPKQKVKNVEAPGIQKENVLVAYFVTHENQVNV